MSNDLHSHQTALGAGAAAHRQHAARLLLVCAAALACAAPATADTLTIYSYCAPGNPLKHSHSWAVFERGCQKVVISWGPAQGDGTDAVRRVVKGKNYSHEDTVTFAVSKRLTVRSEGPFKVTPALFDRASRWAQELASGRVGYCLTDCKHRPAAVNCASAVMLVTGSRRVTLTRHGPTMTPAIVRHFKAWME